MENLFVIIVTYNGEKWIDKCLSSVYKSTIPLTTIVIDNKSSDNTVQYIKTNFPMVILFEYQNNLGILEKLIISVLNMHSKIMLTIYTCSIKMPGLILIHSKV